MKGLEDFSIRPLQMHLIFGFKFKGVIRGCVTSLVLFRPQISQVSLYCMDRLALHSIFVTHKTSLIINLKYHITKDPITLLHKY